MNAIGIQRDGKVLVGGSIIGRTRPLIARLNADGRLDPTFSTGLLQLGEVDSILVQDDQKVVVGGFFTTVRNTDQAPRQNLARLLGDVSDVRLAVQGIDGLVVLIWTDPGYVLQSAPRVEGPYGDVAGADSPYLASVRTQQFYRLRSR